MVVGASVSMYSTLIYYFERFLIVILLFILITGEANAWKMYWKCDEIAVTNHLLDEQNTGSWCFINANAMRQEKQSLADWWWIKHLETLNIKRLIYLMDSIFQKKKTILPDIFPEISSSLPGQFIHKCEHIFTYDRIACSLAFTLSSH